jgi:hypothetical protein
MIKYALRRRDLIDNTIVEKIPEKFYHKVFSVLYLDPNHK